MHAGTTCSIGLRIANTQRRVPAFAVLVEDRVRDASGATQPAGRSFALRIGAGESVLRSYRFVPARRGALAFSHFQVFTRFPFGLFSKSLTLPGQGSALVYPAIEPVSVPPSLGAARERGDGVTGDRGQGALAIGLRGYERGDSHRRVHWPASLRRGDLLVRLLENERRPEVEVRLRTDVSPDAAFERAVSWAASEIVALIAAGARVALHTSHERFEADAGPGQRGRLMSYLARVEPQLRTPGPA